MKILILLILMTILFSCNKENQSFKLIKVTEYSSSKVSDSALVKILEKNNINIDISYTLSEDYALKQLEENKVDLVIIPNNAGNDDLEFKLLSPLLPRLLMIYTNKETKIKDLKELFERGNIYFEDRSKLDSLFFKKLYYNFNIDESKIKANSSDKLYLNQTSDSLLVYVGLTHLNNRLVKQMAEFNWSLFSLDDVRNYGRGSKIEGFTMMNNSAYPFLIPMNVYKGKPEKPILTIAIKDVLIASEDLNIDIAYVIVETLAENKMHLIRMNSIYNLLDFDFDNQIWAFPLHLGAKKYLDREKPSPIMHWVNNFWPIMSLLVIFIAGFSSFRNIWKKKNKQSIESYYNALIKIKDKFILLEETTDINNLLHELNNLKAKAIDTLANNKFHSSDSFNIFLALYTEMENDLNDKLKENHKRI